MLFSDKQAHSGAVLALAILPSADGILLSGGEDGLVRAWEICPVDEQLTALNDMAVREDEADLDSYIPPPSPAHMPKHNRRGSVNAVFIKLAESKVHSSAVCSLAVLPDGKIVSGSKDHSIGIHLYSNNNIGGFQNLQHIKNAHSHTVLSLACSPSSGVLYSGSGDNTIRSWQWNETKLDNTKTLKGHTNLVYSIALLDDNKLVSCSSDKKILLWDTKTGTSQPVYTHQEPVLCLLALRDGRVVAGTSDNFICLFDPNAKNQNAKSPPIARAEASGAKQIWAITLLP
jgi:WD40 repeat protein